MEGGEEWGGTREKAPEQPPVPLADEPGSSRCYYGEVDHQGNRPEYYSVHE